MRGQSRRLNRSELARKLRGDMTDAERQLWRALRGRQLSDHKFRRQHPFEGYVLDFVCLEAKVVVEVDGGQHAELTDEDAARTAILEAAGFRVLRFWNPEVLRDTEAVVERIWQVLESGE